MSEVEIAKELGLGLGVIRLVIDLYEKEEQASEIKILFKRSGNRNPDHNDHLYHRDSCKSGSDVFR